MDSQVNAVLSGNIQAFMAQGRDVRYLLDIAHNEEGHVTSIKLKRAVDFGVPETLFSQEYPVPTVKQLPALAQIPKIPAGTIGQPYKITWQPVQPYMWNTSSTAPAVMPYPGMPVANPVPERVLDAPIPEPVYHYWNEVLDSQGKAAYQPDSKITLILSELGTYRIFHGELRSVSVDIAVSEEELRDISHYEDYPFDLDSESWIQVPLYLD